VVSLESSLLKGGARRFQVISPAPSPSPSCESPLKILRNLVQLLAIIPISQHGNEIHRAVGIEKTWYIRAGLLLIPTVQQTP
jgi:hypothetical protein